MESLARHTAPAQQSLLHVVEDDVDLSKEALALRKRASRRNTETAYSAAWEIFTEFCRDRGLRQVPATPKTVSEYLTYLHTVKKYAVRTIKQHKAAIRRYHHARGHVDPSKDQVVADTWSGIILSATQDEPKVTLALWQRAVETVVDAIERDLVELKKMHRGSIPPEDRLPLLRDRALVLVSASSAMLTTGEIRSLRVEEIAAADGGWTVRVQRSPDAVAIPRFARIRYAHDARYCPIRAIEDWVRVAEIRGEGAIFRAIDRYGHVSTAPLSSQNINAIVKRRCGLAGIQPDRISMRSLRKGAMQQRAYEGATDAQIIDDAGLSEYQASEVSALAAPARELRMKKLPAPVASRVTSSPY